MLVVLVERQASFLRHSGYKLLRMLAGARRAGIEAEVTDRPERVSGRAPGFLHVDLTLVPAPFLDAAGRLDRCVNGAVASIHRGLYSAARLERDSDWTGPVIVKTVLNHRGLPELNYGFGPGVAGRLRRLAARVRSPDYKDDLCPRYRILPALSDVPEEVWSDARLMVERFLPGALGGPIVKHRWDFAMEASLVTRSIYDDPLCGVDSVREVGDAGPPPDALVALREAMALDFGSIDFFETEDGAIPVDVNKTNTVDQSWIEAFPFVARHIEECTEALIAFAREGER
ncbi:MAG: hypothetical protein ACPGID_10480 [Rubricella sp.]